MCKGMCRGGRYDPKAELVMSDICGGRSCVFVGKIELKVNLGKQVDKNQLEKLRMIQNGTRSLLKNV